MGIISSLFEGGITSGVILAIIAFVVLCFLIIPFVLMVCWNFIMPQMFGLPELNIWTALAIWLIFSILFGGIKVHKQ